MQPSLASIQSKLRSYQPNLAREFSVKRLGIFGSYVHGDMHEGSDIDLLVELDTPVSLFRFIALEQALSELLGQKVDLVTPEGLKPAIKQGILQQLVYV